MRFFHAFLQSVQKDAGILSQIRRQPLPAKCCPVYLLHIHHSTIYIQTPIQRLPEWTPNETQEQKFPFIQHLNWPSPPTQRHELRWQNNGAVSGVDSRARMCLCVCVCVWLWNRNRVVGIATRLRAGLYEVRISAGPKDLSLQKNVQTGFRGLHNLHFSDTGVFF